MTLEIPLARRHPAGLPRRCDGATCSLTTPSQTPPVVLSVPCYIRPCCSPDYRGSCCFRETALPTPVCALSPHSLPSFLPTSRPSFLPSSGTDERRVQPFACRPDAVHHAKPCWWQGTGGNGRRSHCLENQPRRLGGVRESEVYWRSWPQAQGAEEIGKGRQSSGREGFFFRGGAHGDVAQARQETAGHPCVVFLVRKSERRKILRLFCALVSVQLTVAFVGVAVRPVSLRWCDSLHGLVIIAKGAFFLMGDFTTR